mmetsp:Transcript_24857/g.44228  ORF Transcript_24857/g.44228 Transcript_24857/m.44228 type:complete len:144 (+) Transcript_24857:26-457(+)
MPPKRSAKRPVGRPPKIRRTENESVILNAQPDKDYSFKNKDYSGISKKRGRGGGRGWKNLRQTISIENYHKVPANVPTYGSIQVGPSVLPSKKYCDITGYEAKYKEPRTGLYFCSSALYRTVKNMPPTVKEQHLKIRGANVKL